MSNFHIGDPKLRAEADARDREEAKASAIVGLVLIALLAAAPFACNAWTCARRWNGSGMMTSYGPIQGCQVEVAPGRLMPEASVRAQP